MCTFVCCKIPTLDWLHSLVIFHDDDIDLNLFSVQICPLSLHYHCLSPFHQGAHHEDLTEGQNTLWRFHSFTNELVKRTTMKCLPYTAQHLTSRACVEVTHTSAD